MTNPHDLALLEVDGVKATLTLNRADKRNALNLDLLQALHARVDELDTLPDVQVLTITGAGKSFCAGMDLKQVMGDSKAGLALLRSLAELTCRVRTLPMAVVGVIRGAAIGGGCGLTCVCDFSLTHDDAVLGYPEVDLGLCPAVVTPWVVRRIGSGPAREMLLAGGTFKGSHAAEIGLVTRSLATTDELEVAASDLVGSLAQAGPEALRATKSLLNSIDGSDSDQVVLEGAELSAEVLASPDAQARLSARFKS